LLLMRIILLVLLIQPVIVDSASANAFSDRMAGINPPLDIDFGFDTRIRQVTLHNATDFDNQSEAVMKLDTNFFRVRHRVWTKLKFNAGFNIYGRVTTEWRKYFDATYGTSADQQATISYPNAEKSEIVWDNIYLDVPKLPLVPASLRVGRQDLIRGEGFVLLDGGPLDGSRTIYQNAILVGVDGGQLGWKDSKIDLFAIRNLARDRHIVHNDQKRQITEKDETAFGIYLQNKSSFLNNESESYYIYKAETNGNKDLFASFSSVSPAPARLPDTRIHTIGQRMKGALPWSMSFALEGAIQTGSIHNPITRDKYADHQAYGGYLHLSRSFLMMLKPEIKAGCVLLSGDKQDTPDHEGWNPVFSRWPKWSELYIYSLLNDEKRIAYWQNLLMYHAGAKMSISKELSLTYSYMHLAAPQSRLGTGKKRGSLHAWKFTAQISKSVASHFLIESFHAGDFYLDPVTDSKKDVARFIRWELSVKK